MRAKKKLSTKYLLFDLFSLLLSFIIVSLIRRDGQILSSDLSLFLWVLVAYFLVSYFLGFYDVRVFSNYSDLFNLLFTRVVLVLSGLSVLFIIIIEESFSRFITINTILLSSLINLFLSIFIFKIEPNDEYLVIKGRSNRIILIKIFNYILFVILCYFNCNSKNNIIFNNIIVAFFGLILYLTINNLEHKFIEKKHYKNFWFFQWDHIKPNILFGGTLLTLLLLYFDKHFLVKSNVLINLIIFGFIDFILVSIVYFNKITNHKFEITKNKIFKANEVDDYFIKQNGSAKGKYKLNNPYNYYLAESLSDVYLKQYSSVFKFIDDTIDLFTIDFRKSIIIRSSDTYNIEVIPNKSIEFYTNLHEVNDFRRVNEYFIKVNEALADGGIFIGNFEPLHLRSLKISKKYPYYLGKFFYLFDFIWKRIFPKLPFLKYFYFELTKGKNRVFSVSEVLGRLYYCGFKVLSIKQIEERIYFVAIKNGRKYLNQQPTYGPLIKLKRVGLNGKPIWVYKLRTMSPYSEFLQEYIYENYKLKKGGKFDNDFRVTGWGKLLRKLWIDEFPMFINFFKGELKLVGVRPISFHYFNLYPEDFRNRRINYKPGLVPPFYYDLPKTFEEIVNSEKKYLDQYDKNPLITDIKYFLGAFKNIIFKKARSA
jgi:lipopolysaccharide/colanic/teichoic acid biosynthesis glycosyltransferase